MKASHAYILIALIPGFFLSLLGCYLLLKDHTEAGGWTLAFGVAVLAFSNVKEGGNG